MLQIFYPLYNLAESFIDSVVRDTVVRPAVGGIVWCEMGLDVTRHSGIYVGYGMIVHLDGDGRVCRDNARTFMARLNGWNTAMSIYTDCQGVKPAGDPAVAKRARASVGQTRTYNLLSNNCHRFTAECISGESCPDVTMASSLDVYRKGDTWRVWETPVK